VRPPGWPVIGWLRELPWQCFHLRPEPQASPQQLAHGLHRRADVAEERPTKADRDWLRSWDQLKLAGA
jgi:hypothetical protein